MLASKDRIALGSDPVALRTWSANPFIKLSRLVVLLSRFHTG